MITDDFVEDPPMSFIVDDKISADEEVCLKIAINFGGIVCYDAPDHIGGFKSLHGKRFRLAYTLAPEFTLPLRTGKPIALSTLIRRTYSSPPSQGKLI